MRERRERERERDYIFSVSIGNSQQHQESAMEISGSTQWHAHSPSLLSFARLLLFEIALHIKTPKQRQREENRYAHSFTTVAVVSKQMGFALRFYTISRWEVITLAQSSHPKASLIVWRLPVFSGNTVIVVTLPVFSGNTVIVVTLPVFSGNTVIVSDFACVFR